MNFYFSDIFYMKNNITYCFSKEKCSKFTIQSFGAVQKCLDARRAKPEK
jgi:hypothetical protein